MEVQVSKGAVLIVNALTYVSINMLQTNQGHIHKLRHVGLGDTNRRVL